jgi:hypothetical protein
MVSSSLLMFVDVFKDKKKWAETHFSSEKVVLLNKE